MTALTRMPNTTVSKKTRDDGGRSDGGDGAQGLVPQARPFGLAVVLELAEGLAGPLPAVEVLRFDQRMPVLLPRIPNWPRRHEEPEPRNRSASSVTHAALASKGARRGGVPPIGGAAGPAARRAG